MLTVLKVMCVNSLKKRITLPKDWFKKTENYFLFTYLMDGKTRFLQVELNEDGAEFFQDNGFITSYEGSGKFLKMYINNTLYVPGKHGELLQWERSAEVQWKDIKIYSSDVIHFAAKHEFDMTSSIMGFAVKSKGKLRNINSNITYEQAA